MRSHVHLYVRGFKITQAPSPAGQPFCRAFCGCWFWGLYFQAIFERFWSSRCSVTPFSGIRQLVYPAEPRPKEKEAKRKMEATARAVKRTPLCQRFPSSASLRSGVTWSPSPSRPPPLKSYRMKHTTSSAVPALPVIQSLCHFKTLSGCGGI